MRMLTSVLASSAIRLGPNAQVAAQPLPAAITAASLILKHMPRGAQIFGQGWCHDQTGEEAADEGSGDAQALD